ncbi:D(3) dopamine receptor [Polyodon spathula]|uniref:D(3) dopamine receptor n=1 Tax=Polyodon spathula TaxID=7913 RepID=UPI001B7DE810|nr:D(3) dopamine receptor [Polyodon spathula]
MALLSGAGSSVNVTGVFLRVDNSTEEQDADHHPNYYAILYSALIFAIILGNVLVCLAVLREKSLQTNTNYLVVSLAVADLLVASLVMPWVVYLEVVGGDWMFSRMYCDVFVTLDVMMCTASILNLCAISIDRYTAVVMPILYNTTHSSKKRVTLMITAVWILAFVVSCPLLFGFNTTEHPNICSISNPEFVVYSSVVSFYLPFIVTLLVYIRIYVFLRKRRKRIAFRQASEKLKSGGYHRPLQTSLHAEGVKDAIPKEEMGLSPIKIEVVSKTHFSKQNTPIHICISICLENTEEPARVNLHSITSCLKLKKQKAVPSENNFLAPVDVQNDCSVSQASFARTENEVDGEEEVRETISQLPKRSSEVRNLPNGKTRIALQPVSKRRNRQDRERKATQMLAVVLGVFLICWLPFFVTHIVNTHCKQCHVPPEVYSATTWLGYVNSALNPVIYTTFNIEFRRAFIKILSC